MRTRALWAIALLLALALCIAVVGCAGSDSGGPGTGGTDAKGSGNATGLPQSSDAALDAGRLLIESKCTMCHTLDRVKEADKNRAEWETTIARMRSNGLVATNAEVEQILAYLESR